MRNLMETNQKTGVARCNVTMGNKEFLKSPMGTLLTMENLVMFTADSILLFVALSPWLRHFNNDKFRLVIFAAYPLSTYLLTYAVGFMRNASFRSDLFPTWAMFLMLILGTADFSAYNLEDNERWKSYRLQFGIKSVWMLVLIGLYVHEHSGAVTAAVGLALFLFVKCEERVWAMRAASRNSLVRNAKVVADYMSMEQESEGISCTEVDPVRMRGHAFLVSGEKESSVNDIFLAIKRCLGMKTARPVPLPAPDYRMMLDKDQLITIEKVWKCQGLLSSQGDPHNELKDICLSFALFKLLCLRYAGYSMPQEAHKKTWKLICKGLLLEENDYKRVFQIIEIELVFLFEFFYTKYSIIFQPFWLLNRLMDLVSIVIGIWAAISVSKHYKRPNSICRLPTIPSWLNYEVLTTAIMIISFILVQLRQFSFMITSEWAKVTLICKYVQKESWQGNARIERMIKGLCGVRMVKPWVRKLRQYSFLESYSYKPFRLLNNECMVAFVDQCRDGQRQSTPILLPEEVKKGVFHALKLIKDTKLKNGLVSLTKNNVFEKLSWACQLETQTQVIMVWHIATSFCEYQLPVRRFDSSAMGTNFLVATSLSKYLAYLVAFTPRLLPDHSYVVEHVFDQAIIEAKDFFQGCKSINDQVTKMERKGHGNSAHERTIIHRGAWLGNQLVDDIKCEDKVWKILADFWVELVLYVAPSDDVKAHAEHLIRGGEFVTHLWALLTHAGIQRSSY